MVNVVMLSVIRPSVVEPPLYPKCQNAKMLKCQNAKMPECQNAKMPLLKKCLIAVMTVHKFPSYIRGTYNVVAQMSLALMSFGQKSKHLYKVT